MNRVILDPVSKRFVDTGEKKQVSEEIRRKISFTKLGRHHSEETKRKIALANKGLGLGKHLSKEHKRKLGIAHKGRHLSEEHKAKIGIANKGRGLNRQLSKEHKRKLSLAHKGQGLGRQLSQETKGKLSEIKIQQWQDLDFIKRFIETHNLKPNKAEIYLQSVLNIYYPNIYKYVGDFQVNIGGRFPDFIDVNGKKEVIELFGNFWHDQEDVEETISHYKGYGFSCIIIWEDELKNIPALIEHIKTKEAYIPDYYGKTSKDYHRKENKGGGKIIILDPVTKTFSQVGSNVKNRG